MRNEEIRAQRYCADQLIMKRLDRPRAHHTIGRRKIDQIVVVNDERSEAKLRSARPHPRARRENLQRIRAELRGGIERPSNVSSDRSVDADAEATVLPGRRL